MMATSSTLLLLAVLPALFATALGVCDYMACYQKFNLIGTDNLFCDGARVVVDCAETTLDNNPDCEHVAKDIDDVIARVKKVLKCNDCGGNSVSVSFLTLCFGLALATYFSRSK